MTIILEGLAVRDEAMRYTQEEEGTWTVAKRPVVSREIVNKDRKVVNATCENVLNITGPTIGALLP